MTVHSPASATWSGSWVTDHLGVRLRTDRGAGGLTAEDLAGLALRVNPRRAHLLVSRVLGKHVPADPRLVHGAGRLLGALAADRLAGRDSGLADAGGHLVRASLFGDRSAAGRLLALCEAHRLGHAAPEVLAIGYAETATGLGHSVADSLDADYLHSTRRAVSGMRPVGVFDEAHSHAARHLLLPEEPTLLGGGRPVVLVDDELSTGATVVETIRALHAIVPRPRYLVASLLDLRSADDRARLQDLARDLAVSVDVVALVTGQVTVPPDALTRGAQLAARFRAAVPVNAGAVGGPGPPRPPVVGLWPAGVRDGGRHGFRVADRPAFEEGLSETARALVPGLVTARGRLLVLGTEELMYLPMRLAATLADLLSPAGVDVLFSSTTRSPVVPVDDAGYAIRTGLTFGAHDDPDDGPGPRYAYNVAAPSGGTPFDAALLVVDDRSTAWPHGDALPLRLAGAVAGPVAVLAVPSHRPAAVPAGRAG